METILLVLVIIIAVVMTIAIVFLREAEADMSLMTSGASSKGYKKFSPASKFIMLMALTFVVLSLSLSVIWNRQTQTGNFEFLNQENEVNSTSKQSDEKAKKDPLLPN